MGLPAFLPWEELRRLGFVQLGKYLFETLHEEIQVCVDLCETRRDVISRCPHPAWIIRKSGRKATAERLETGHWLKISELVSYQLNATGDLFCVTTEQGMSF